jgi:phosphoribosylformylglycinamidine synthase II
LLDFALRGEERRRIQEALGREPSVVELRAFDAQWSEHCSYKSSRAQLGRLPTKGEAVVVGPGEDAGILHLGVHEGERYAVVVAHESHNHPSQVVPFEGAATGVGGIVRDVLCMGAQVVGVADALRLGDVGDPRSHQRHVAQAVVEGIGAYGNAIGVPNLAGDVYFDGGFDENCLVNVIALGLVKEREIVHSWAPADSEGWPIVLVGKATDASGFGGAAFSSLALDSENEAANKGAVQVPDPFLKNVLMRATYRVFALLHERRITAACKDLGAGGVMGCSAEICASGGFGARVDLDRINVAQEHLAPEVLAVGETQERLLFVLPPEIVADVLRIYNEEFALPDVAYNARAVVIGSVTREKRYVLTHRGDVVMDVDIDFLTSAPPPARDHRALETLLASPSGLRSYSAASSLRLPGSARRSDVPWHDDLSPEVVASMEACSREPLYVRYDSVVRGRTVIPRGDADAGVIAPIPGSPLGVALAVAGNPQIGRENPRRAAQMAVFEAARKVVAVGAVPIGLTDCLNFGNPEGAEHYAEFVAAVDGLGSAARNLGLPYVSGNVSFYNERSDGQAIPASAIVACVGRVTDVARVVTPSLKEAGSKLVFVEDIGMVREAIEEGTVLACKVVGIGGVLAAIAEMAFAAMREGRTLGAELTLGAGPTDRSVAENGGFIVEATSDASLLCHLEPATRASAERRRGTASESIAGSVSSEPYVVVDGERYALDALYDAWMKPLEEIYP